MDSLHSVGSPSEEPPSVDLDSKCDSPNINNNSSLPDSEPQQADIEGIESIKLEDTANGEIQLSLKMRFI